jgi:hypothetical protein
MRASRPIFLTSRKPMMFYSLGSSCFQELPVGSPIKKRLFQTMRQTGHSNCRNTFSPENPESYPIKISVVRERQENN